MPAATRRASTGRPAKAWPRARTPSREMPRRGSRRIAIVASRTIGSSSSQRSESATPRATTFHATRPAGSLHHASPKRTMARCAARLARRPVPRRRERDRVQRLQRGRAGPLRASGVPHRVVHRLQEDRERPEDVADRVVDHRRQVGGRDLVRDRLQRAADDGLPTLVVEVGGPASEQPERVTRALGEQPLVERADRLAGALEPARRSLVVLAMASGPDQLLVQLLAYQRMDPEPVLGPEAVHEQPLRLTAQEQLARVAAPGDRRRQHRTDAVDDGHPHEEVDDVGFARREDLVPDVVLGQQPGARPRRRRPELRPGRAGRQPHQLQSGRPTVRVLHPPLDVRLGELRGEAGEDLAGLRRA